MDSYVDECSRAFDENHFLTEYDRYAAFTADVTRGSVRRYHEGIPLHSIRFRACPPKH